MKKPIYLLDTNIISELLKVAPNPQVIEKIEQFKERCVISTTVWNELLFSVHSGPNGKKKDYMLSYLVDVIQAAFPIISFDSHAAWINADLRTRLKSERETLDLFDTEIAATAISEQLILVTKDTKSFESIQNVSSVLYTENWFE